MFQTFFTCKIQRRGRKKAAKGVRIRERGERGESQELGARMPLCGKWVLATAAAKTLRYICISQIYISKICICKIKVGIAKDRDGGGGGKDKATARGTAKGVSGYNKLVYLASHSLLSVSVVEILIFLTKIK